MPVPDKAFIEIFGMKIRDGCGDHSCLVRKTHGMGTNGGCRCIPPGTKFAYRVQITRELQRLGYPK
jgi:hypothetical protein